MSHNFFGAIKFVPGLKNFFQRNIKNIVATPLAATVIFATAFSAAPGASFVGAEIKLCNNGYTIDRTNCRTYTQGSCSSGNIMIDTSRSSFKPSSGGTCADPDHYMVVSIPAGFEILNSYISGAERKLCAKGYSINGTSCRTYAQGSCASGNVMIDMPRTSLKSTTKNGTCANDLVAKSLPNGFEVLNSYLINGFSPKICTNGYTTNRSSCTTYGSTNCPTNYRNMGLDTSTFGVQSSGACPSDAYSLNSSLDGCRTDVNGSTCIDFCGGSGTLTGVGTCASACSAGATTLRTSTGLILPMWSTKQITPSLNVQIGNSICYVNLVPGSTDESSLVLDVDGTTYHTLEWENPRE